jgi:hypothetical protein
MTAGNRPASGAPLRCVRVRAASVWRILMGRGRKGRYEAGGYAGAFTDVECSDACPLPGQRERQTQDKKGLVNFPHTMLGKNYIARHVDP